MGNTSRAANGRGLTSTGQRVVTRTKPPRARVVNRSGSAHRSPGERERALRHIASSSRGSRTRSPKLLRLLAKIKDALQRIRSRRNS